MKINNIYNGDSLDYLKKIDAESIDIIFSDPHMALEMNAQFKKV